MKLNKYGQKMLKIAPEGTEVYELTMREKPRGWRYAVEFILPGFGSTRTLSEFAPGQFLVGSGEQWQLVRFKSDLTYSLIDVAKALERPASRKSFEYDRLRYTLARRLR
ncbi:MAG TPA: hypothetical protein VFC82_09915 [Actinomycetaceae bacterium]|nr:hypothetical protein [Actinomycetaceae bacterium]